MEVKNIKMKKYAGVVIFALLISLFSLIGMSKYCFSSAMVFIVEEGYMTNFQTGLINSAFWLAYAISQFFGGIIADRWHPERLVLIGLVSSAVSSGLIYFCYENYALTFVIWTVNAFLQFGVYPAVFKIMSALFTDRMMTLALIVLALSTPISVMLSYVLVAIVPSWQMSFLVSSAVLLLFSFAWIAVILTMGGYIKNLHLTGGSESDKRVAEIVTGGTPKQPMSTLVLSSGLLLILVIVVLRGVIGYMPSMMPSVVKSAYDSLTPITSTLISLIPLFCNVLGPLCSSVVATKKKDEIVVAAVIFALILPAGLTTLLLGKVSYWLIITAMAAVTLGASTVTFFIGALVNVKFNKWGKGATVAGFINCAAALGNVVASGFMSWIADNYSWHGTLYAVVAIIVLAIVITVIEIPIWIKFKKIHYYGKG